MNFLLNFQNSKGKVCIFLIFFIFINLEIIFPKDFEIKNSKIIKNSEEFIIKGVNYNPILVGKNPETDFPFGDYMIYEYKNIFERDIALIKDMGANILFISNWNSNFDHSLFLDYCYSGAENKIYLALMFKLTPKSYLNNKKAILDFSEFFKSFNGHPTVIICGVEIDKEFFNDDLTILDDFKLQFEELLTIAEKNKKDSLPFLMFQFPSIEHLLKNENLFLKTLQPDIIGISNFNFTSISQNILLKEANFIFKKPILINNIGVDAFNSEEGNEYEFLGSFEQLDYYEKVWKMILNKEISCIGGVVRSWYDDWWGDKKLKNIEKCEEINPLTQSLCGYKSEDEPDGIHNVEWDGIVRFKKISEKDYEVEPRNIYYLLKILFSSEKLPVSYDISLWDGLNENEYTNIQPSFNLLDLSLPLSVKEIMSAGQLGGPLVPTHRILDKKLLEKINFSFGKAMNEWNLHNWEEAIRLFEEHILEFPQSPWIGEAKLHIGCDAYFHGRFIEAESIFEDIIESYRYFNNFGSKKIVNKAKLRLALLKVAQYDFEEATQIFSDLYNFGSDWRDRTYASHWIQRLSRYNYAKESLVNCGIKAIAYMIKQKDGSEKFQNIEEEVPLNSQGFSFYDLANIAKDYGLKMHGLSLKIEELKKLPLPAIVYMSSSKGIGHFWILTEIANEKVILFDPQTNIYYTQKLKEFETEWSGKALAFIEDEKNIFGKILNEQEMISITGGCCGSPREVEDLGNPGNESGPGEEGCAKGFPVWSVNMITINLFVADVPIWYKNQIGPSMYLILAYNSQSSGNYYEPFGNKWIFSYGSFLTEDTNGNVTIFMPDGRMDVYTKTTSGYTPPLQVFNTLTKIASNHFELKLKDDTILVYNAPVGSSSLLKEIKDAHGRSLILEYNANGKLTKITDALGRITNFTYNAQGLVSKVQDPFGRSASFEYDANKNLIKITDMAGNINSFTYASNSYLSSIAYPNRTYNFYIEPADGVVDYSDDYPPPGAHTWQSYRITVTDPLGYKEEYFYHGGCGGAIGVYACGYSWYVSKEHYVPYTSPTQNNFRSAKKLLYFNSTVSGKGVLTKIENPLGNYISYEYYYSSGLLKKIKNTLGNAAEITYDSRGNVLEVKNPLGQKITYSYDNEDNLISIKDPKNRTVSFVYDSRNNLITTIDPQAPSNGTTSISYNEYDLPVSLTDAQNHTYLFEYNTNGFLTKMISPKGGMDNYSYDSKGRLTSHTDPNGKTTQYQYDNLDRLTKITYFDGTSVTYQYDCCSLKSVTNSNGTVTFNYNSALQLTSFTDVYNKTVTFERNKNGQVTKMIYPGSKNVLYEYNDAGFLVKVTDWLGKSTTYEYDLVGNLKKTTYPDGSIIAKKYDSEDRLLSILDYNSQSAFLNLSYDYTLDEIGNRTTIKSNQPLQAIPSLSQTNYTYDEDNKLLSAGSSTFQYDANGNTVSKVSGGSTYNFTWYPNNRLKQITVGSNTISFKYNGFGGLISKTENGVETRYIINNAGSLSEIIAEMNSSGTIQNYYIYGLGLISKITSSGQAYYYHYDGTGTTIALTDSNGQIVNKYAYDSFGSIINQTEGTSNPFKFVGKYGVMDFTNYGLYFMRARFYDPEIGRFINKDPMSFLSGINLYLYAGNNPINNIDPKGDFFIFIQASLFFKIMASFLTGFTVVSNTLLLYLQYKDIFASLKNAYYCGNYTIPESLYYDYIGIDKIFLPSIYQFNYYPQWSSY